MKKRVFFKSMVVITGLLLHFNLLAADVPPITLHVGTAGTLSTLISTNEKYEITDLTLTGNLNGTDIRFIREMAGRDIDRKATIGKLTKLNLVEANIVAGGDYYYRAGSIYNYSFNKCIGDMFFYECANLTSVIMPNSVTSIGNNAFSGCTGLTSVTIGNNVTSIGQGAFGNCIKLTSITIPNSVKSIENDVFGTCSGLTSVIIGSEVTSIGRLAFTKCTKLMEIHSKNPIPPSIPNVNAFNTNGEKCKLYVPKGSLQAYQKATGWSYFQIIIEETVTYLVSVVSDENGKVLLNNEDISSEDVEGDKTVAFTILPNNGYFIDKVKFNNSDVTSQVKYNTFISPAITQNSVLDVTFKRNVFTSTNQANKDNISIQSFSNGIAIETTEQMFVSVYNLSGQAVYRNVINGNTEILLNKGVYIVRVNNESQKVIVK